MHHDPIFGINDFYDSWTPDEPVKVEVLKNGFRDAISMAKNPNGVYAMKRKAKNKQQKASRIKNR